MSLFCVADDAFLGLPRLFDACEMPSFAGLADVDAMGVASCAEDLVEPCSSEPARASLLVLPRFRGRLVPGGAERLTVQYEPNPGSVTGRGCRSKSRFRER